jgi:osmoprotectant transport system permease protein
MLRCGLALLLSVIGGLPIQGQQPAPVTIGSKAFTESVILAELAKQVIERAGLPTRHRPELGGTRLLWDALCHGEIDLYPEYTGTIRQEIFAGRQVNSDDALSNALAESGISMSRPLGFNDTYAIGMKEATAARLGIQKISDLQQHPALRFGFSNEFMDRADGWPSLHRRYLLPQQDVKGLEHAVAYRGLEGGSIDATDLYSTDPEIQYYGLRILEDDQRQFPAYHAVFLYRGDLANKNPGAVAALKQLEGRIPLVAIIGMNARAKPKTGARTPEAQVAADFLNANPFFSGTPTEEQSVSVRPAEKGMLGRLLQRTGEHLFLVAVSMAIAIAVAVPLGILAARRHQVGQIILAAAGIVQTIPSLALLVFIMALLYLIPELPFFHKLPALGTLPAVVALFLYSLLPIIRNTYAGLEGIPRPLRESAEALGLPPGARLRWVELPLASRSILAGVKTSAVINIGTATLGALIGAGGYGQPILTGIRLDNIGLILEGAIPAAVLALVVQWLFDAAELVLVPKGLRL